MTCQETNHQLDEYIAGELTPEQKIAIEQHIANCNECSSELMLRRALLARTRALPRELWPQQELWPNILNQINNRKIQPLYPRTQSWVQRWQVWGAAAACLAIIAIVWGIGQFGADQSPNINSPMIGGNTPQLSVAIGENQQYQQVRQRIQQTLHLNKAELSPETVSVIEKNITVIDDAVAEINKALSEDPENPNLKLMLVATQQQAADLLESIAEVRTQQSTTTNELEKKPQ